jgi:pyruvate dehydrogenase E2 component (dihydrolipoamide acetyltransferase)
MTTKIFLPRLGESIEEAAIGRWCKQVGEPVERGEVIAELETAKAMMELESPVKGILLAVFPEIGKTIQMGELVAIVGNADEDWQAELDKEMGKTAQQISQAKGKAVKRRTHKKSTDQVRISPNAKRIARELSVDLQAIGQKKTGERITAEDVQRFAENLRKNEGREIPFRKIQLNIVEKITAQRMMESVRSIPQFSISMLVGADRALAVIKRKLDESGKRITLTTMLIKAAAEILTKHPRLNARFEQEAVFAYQAVNIAVAVSTAHGLYVPVIHQADKLSIEEIEERLDELIGKCHQKTLQFADTDGGTFTISNLGMKGVQQFVPIIDPSQAAILGVGAVQDRIVFLPDGTLSSQQELTLTLTSDHRVIDGAGAAEFLHDLKTLIENV